MCFLFALFFSCCICEIMTLADRCVPAHTDLHSLFITGDQFSLCLRCYLGCSIYVPLFIIFYASVNHILVMGPFLRIGDIMPHKHKNRITNLIM